MLQLISRLSIASPPRTGGDRRHFLGAERGSLFSAASGARARLRIHQRRIDRFQYIVDFAIHLLVPKPYHSVALLIELRSARSIFPLCRGLSLLASVKFDSEAVGDATKVNEVKPDAVLAAKFETAETPGSEVLPELALLVSRFKTQLAATLARQLVVSRHDNRALTRA
jgi:hypothetical protein